MTPRERAEFVLNDQIQLITKMICEAVKAEREACARLVETISVAPWDLPGEVAAKIRARKNQ